MTNWRKEFIEINEKRNWKWREIIWLVLIECWRAIWFNGSSCWPCDRWSGIDTLNLGNQDIYFCDISMHDLIFWNDSRFVFTSICYRHMTRFNQIEYANETVDGWLIHFVFDLNIPSIILRIDVFSSIDPIIITQQQNFIQHSLFEWMSYMRSRD